MTVATPGSPSWVDLGTADVEDAKRFYTRLFGWAVETSGDDYGGYTTFLLNGVPVAGAGPLYGEGQPTAWSTYFATTDADEMAARVEVLLRRNNALKTAQTALRVADLELNLISREASRADQPLTLLPTEYKLLEFLMRNTGQILSRMMIFEEVWGYHFDPGTNLIDVHIGRLRKKIDPPGLTPLIRTVRGSGYVIAEPL